MNLRNIEESDLPRLRDHRNRLDTRRYLGNAEPVTEAEQLAWWKKRDPSAHLIAHRSGIDIGLVRVTDVTTEGACVGADVFHEARGHGLGHLVFEAACNLARKRAREAWFHMQSRVSPPRPDSWYPKTLTLWLRVFAENQPAMRIYTKAGFKVDVNDQVQVYYRQTQPNGSFAALHYIRMTRRIEALPLKEDV